MAAFPLNEIAAGMIKLALFIIETVLTRAFAFHSCCLPFRPAARPVNNEDTLRCEAGLKDDVQFNFQQKAAGLQCRVGRDCDLKIPPTRIGPLKLEETGWLCQHAPRLRC